MLSRREKRWAAIFADELLPGCEALVQAYGEPPLTLPISIPIDPDGVVLLRPSGPLDAPRVASRLKVARAAPGSWHIAIERVDGGPIVIPGIRDEATGADAPLTVLALDVNKRGMTIAGDLTFDENTARSLANAVLITINVKLHKAGRPA